MSADRDDALIGLSRAKAALWLLDQIHVGELSFLQQDPRTAPPRWITGDLRLTRRDVASWLEDMAIRAAAQGVKEAEDALRKGGEPEKAVA